MSAIDPTRDRMAVISGAGTGVGRAIAVKFGPLGWRGGLP
jgi:NAD(P)-dependent dehydrogenase (short-subunit alcohol dehydrogenase family)